MEIPKGDHKRWKIAKVGLENKNDSMKEENPYNSSGCQIRRSCNMRRIKGCVQLNLKIKILKEIVL